MPTKSDQTFVKIAIEKGYLAPEDGRHVLVRLRQAEENGARLSVDRLMVMEEFLSAIQVQEIQAEQKRRVVFCVCGQKTNIFEFEAGQRVKCKNCGRVMEIPREDARHKTSPHGPS